MSNGFLGSRHDMAHFSAHYPVYNAYLRATEDDLRNLEQQDRFQTWDLMADKGYQGATELVQTYRVITPTKGSNLPRATVARNRDIALLRVPVECFFGRMYKLYTMFSKTYTLSHEHFDMDFNNCAYLTNYSMSATGVSNSDAEYYRGVLVQQRLNYAERVEKRKRENQEYRERKRRRLEELMDPEDYDE